MQDLAVSAAHGVLLKVENLPNLAGKSEPPERYLANMFNPTLTILPDYDSKSGKPVQRAWHPQPCLVVLEMQNAALAASATRILNGLDLFGQKLEVSRLSAPEAANMDLF